jgi:hypothetical protein
VSEYPETCKVLDDNEMDEKKASEEYAATSAKVKEGFPLEAELYKEMSKDEARHLHNIQMIKKQVGCE